MKKLRLFLTAIMSLVAFGGMGFVNAAVTGSITEETTNHAITLSKSVTGATGPVTNTFTYTVTPAASNPGTVTGAPTTKQIVFNGATISNGTVTKTETLDFSGTTFTANGDYIFNITETGSTNSTTYPVDNTNKYSVKVSVRNKSASDFTEKEIKMLLYSGENAVVASKLNNTTFTFTTQSVLRTLELSHTVSGTMADADLCFPVSVNIGGNGTYTVTTESTCTSNPANLTGGTAGNVYLKHGDTVTISGIIQGTTYSLTESNETPYSNYTTTIGGTAGKSLANQTIGVTNTKAITNEYAGTAITGGFFRTLPYIAIVAAVLGVMVAIVVRNQKAKKLDDQLDM